MFISRQKVGRQNRCLCNFHIPHITSKPGITFVRIAYITSLLFPIATQYMPNVEVPIFIGLDTYSRLVHIRVKVGRLPATVPLCYTFPVVRCVWNFPRIILYRTMARCYNHIKQIYSVHFQPKINFHGKYYPLPLLIYFSLVGKLFIVMCLASYRFCRKVYLYFRAKIQ